jgi:hypothetical protein
VIGYGCSALALAVPFLNASGADVRSNAPVSQLNMSWTAVIISFVWLISGFLTLSQKHEHPTACALYACGLPGILIAVLAFLK